METRIRKLLGDGEGLTIEFKRCHDKLSQTVYETVCAFSNRYGGDILLGVEDNGEVTGVASEAVKQLKADFANALNNSQLFVPTLHTELEEVAIDGKIVLWCRVPLMSQLVFYKSRLFDRSADGDVDITRNSDLAAMMYDRKRGVSTDSKILPHISEDDLLLKELMPRIRLRAATIKENHPWLEMSDADILRSASLYQTSRFPELTGYTLAAILLFGREEVIRSVLPGYVTDCILRRDDLDRYDDRLRVSCNLIEAFDKIMEFIAKHTLDRFYLEGVQSVSPRSKIAREIVSNILSHREFTSTVPAKVIIERDRIVAENWCLPKLPGKLDPATFTPQPKNPLIANFFVNIGYADTLGSGVRNLYKYTKIYTNGGEPELIEGDMFRTIVPLSLSGTTDDVVENVVENGVDVVVENVAENELQSKIIKLIGEKPTISAKSIAQVVGTAPRTIQRNIDILKSAGIVERIGSANGGHWVVKSPAKG
ncbi:MAG: putative DNA binding domain-containing protein [Oscillospiraceae bacterium]|jgi:ATP-dependent DNA helicase RecG|nr:putative DNA binding domain-containing protein [Oscillospiraceae bacterium]